MASPIKPSPPVRRFALSWADGSFGFFFGAGLILATFVVLASRSGTIEKASFSLTYMGAYIVRQGQGARLYDLGLQAQVRDSIFHNTNPLFYEHPPFEALLFSPLASVSFLTAYKIWGLVNVGIWLTVVLLLRPYLPAPRDNLAYVTLWLLFAPLADALYEGQPSILLLLVYAITFIQVKRGSEFGAGVSLGMGLFKFHFVLPLAFLFLTRKKWRFLGGFMISALFLTLLSLIAVGWHGVVGYVRFLVAISRNPQEIAYGSAIDMPTLEGLLYAALGRAVSHTALALLAAAMSLALLTFLGWRWRITEEQHQDSFEMMFAAAIATSLITGFHTFTHDFSPLILAMFLVMANLHGASSRVRVLLLVPIVLFWIAPLYLVFIAFHLMYAMCPVLMLFAFSALQAANHAERQEATTTVLAR